jgi:hypothetical protein
MTALQLSCWALLALLAASGLSIEDRAIVRILQRAEPSLKHVFILKRFPVSEQLSLVVAIGRPGTGGSEGSNEEFASTTNTRLGLFLQDKVDAGRVYKLAIKAGLAEDYLARIERISGRELVLSGTGEKSTYDNQKFIFDVRAKTLVAHFSYPPFWMSHLLHNPTGPQFVMADAQQLLLVEIGADDQGLRVVPKERARLRLSRIPMEESSVPGDRVYRTPVPPPDATPAFGLRKQFRLTTEKNSDGWDSPLVAEKVGPKEKMYRLPQSDLKTWQLARQDDIARGIPANQPHISEDIGPHQLEGHRLWFGKTFYNGEGLTGVGGFGYFDTATRCYRLYSPSQIHRWSVSAIRVEPDFIWLGLHRRGEYGNGLGGLLRWDRKTEEVRLFDVRLGISHIVRHDDTLYLGGNGIVTLRGDEIQSYFVDRTAGGRYQIVARGEGMMR